MILSIDTIHDITPDMLHDISTQLEQGLQSGRLPYEWSIKSNPTVEESILSDIDSDLETALEAIENTERAFEKLKNLLII